MDVQRLGLVLAILIAAVIGLNLPSWITPKKDAEKVPPFRFEQSQYVIRDIPENDKKDITICLYNDSKENLVISSLRSSCDCVSIVDNHLLGLAMKPGDRCKINVEVKTGSDKSISSANLVASAVSDSNKTVNASCRVSAQIDPEYLVSDTILDFGELNVEPFSTTQTLYVHPSRKTDLQFNGYSVTSPFFKIENEYRDEEGDLALRIVFNINEVPTNTRVYVGLLNVNTNSERRPKFSVYLKARVCPNFSATPSSLVFVSNCKNGNESAFTVSSSNGKFSIIGISTDVPGIDFQFETLTQKAAHAVTATLGGPENGTDGIITVKMRNENGDFGTLKLPIFVVSVGEFK